MVLGTVSWVTVAAIALLPDDLLSMLVDLGPCTRLAAIFALGLLLWHLTRKRFSSPLYLGMILLFVGALSYLFVRNLFVIFEVKNVAAYWFFFLGMLALTLSMGTLINLNRYSLHSIYREGLVRTFLAASRKGPRTENISPPSNVDVSPKERPQFEARRPDPITNIDDDDNPALFWMRTRPERRMPIFLLNASLNGRSPTDHEGRVPRQWPYTFSQYFCGSPACGVGYSYSENVFKASGKAITLGTAMAVSGAAVSPTAGRTTNPLKAFILGVLNARLGLWIGNPSRPATVEQESPSLTGLAVLTELFGIRTRFMRWIHLSDGGHFENLGLYELLRRGCARIVVIDASADPLDLRSDLANAIRRARIDLGIIIRNQEPTDFETDDDDGADGKARKHTFRWFTVDYGRNMPLGRILYIRPIIKDENELPIEVRHYMKISPSFPHETTVDQFFTEAQMEAYRSLGDGCGTEASRVIKISEVQRSFFDKGLASGLLRRAKRAAPQT